ncbi:bifunctional oligoribonuclease/PAP phosphatase NrnA [Dactylosporangium sp. NPDC006015]|uniref:DHH family phosphoesterase n=1 Tax=Dactylosporangium sp. NPDC006015 TaxID=3154576 RepID=UPI0033B10F37
MTAPQPSPGEWAAAVSALRGLPPGARVLLACHVNPDGDALGSMLGFALGLRRFAPSLVVEATFPGPLTVPAPFDELPGVSMLVPAAAVTPPAPTPDAMLVFDAASVERLGDLAGVLAAAPVGIVLDHHASNPGFGAVNLIDPSAAATSVVAEGLLGRLGVALDAEIAECLYVALATDTGSFKHSSTTPAVHELAARLIATGIPVGDISRRLFDTRPHRAVRLFGVALARTAFEPAGGLGLAWTYVTLDDLAEFGQPAGAVEALIDSVRCVAEADVACVVKPIGPHEWSVSLRSKGAVDVSRVAVGLGGGGHRFAAGFSATGTVDEVIAAIRTALTESVVLADQG